MLPRKIKLQNKEIEYRLKKSRRAKNMRLTIYCDGSLVATVPSRYSDGILEEFILEKSDWILKKIEYFNNFSHKEFWVNNPTDFVNSKEKALDLARERINYFNQFYNFSFKKINIRNQRTRWGSCSRSGSLSFNYKIVYLPAKLADYVIVHELCHLQEFNHSRKFWALVKKTVPDCEKIRKEVRRL